MFRIYFEAGKRALMDYDKKHNILTELGSRYYAVTDDLMDIIRIHEEKQKELRSDFFALRQTVIRNRAEERVVRVWIRAKVVFSSMRR